MNGSRFDVETSCLGMWPVRPQTLSSKERMMRPLNDRNQWAWRCLVCSICYLAELDGFKSRWDIIEFIFNIVQASIRGVWLQLIRKRTGCVDGFDGSRQVFIGVDNVLPFQLGEWRFFSVSRKKSWGIIWHIRNRAVMNQLCCPAIRIGGELTHHVRECL